MNLNELFFFKVFPCNKNNNNNFNLNMHDEKNCYFYHFKTNNSIDNKNTIEKDKRREPIQFTEFFKNILSKLKNEENYSISLETIFEFNNKKNNFNFNYYAESLSFELLNGQIFINDSCHNETEFNYHINRYKSNFCRFFKIMKKCKNNFCYSKHIKTEILKNCNNNENYNINIINNINNIINYETDIDEGIIKFRKLIKNWEEKKEIRFKEIIESFNYILSFENKYLSKAKLNEIKQNFEIFQKWYNNIKVKNNKITKLNESKEEIKNYINHKILKNYIKEEKSDKSEQIIKNIYKSIKLINNTSGIYKNSNLLETLKINTNVCFISKYTIIKKDEIVKYVYAMLNSSDGVIIYGGDENNNSIKGINLNRKERDKFKIWFNSEFIKILIKYEDNLEYNFYDLANNINDECVLVIKIKKIKSNQFLIKFPSKCLIIKEKFLNKNKDEKNKILNEENVKELDLREYLEILRKKLLEHYCDKFKIKI